MQCFNLLQWHVTDVYIGCFLGQNTSVLIYQNNSFWRLWKKSNVTLHHARLPREGITWGSVCASPSPLLAFFWPPPCPRTMPPAGRGPGRATALPLLTHLPGLPQPVAVRAIAFTPSSWLKLAWQGLKCVPRHLPMHMGSACSLLARQSFSSKYI